MSRCKACDVRIAKLRWNYSANDWENLCPKCYKAAASAFIELFRIKWRNKGLYELEEMLESEMEDLNEQFGKLLPTKEDL